ncbi:MAG: sigma-54 dependent transcriptional regulator [Planctomycetota bacterium]
MPQRLNSKTPTASRILLIDDDPIVVDAVGALLEAQGFIVTTALGGIEGWARLESESDMFDAVVSDVVMPGLDGIELLRRVREAKLSVAVVMLTGYGSIESAVDALRLGAADYLTKPVVEAELRLAIERAIAQHALLRENASLRQQLDGRYGLDAIVGRDGRMQRVYELVEAVAPSKTTVLMSGESGTGKSLVARAIHQRSDRAGGPFVELACGSIPETLLESELFGHVKGSFTGAHSDKVGKFEAAHNGTLFLDEINSASAGMQLKLLRALQERRFEPVGSNATREVDVRVVLASNEPLEQLVAEKRFRQDLYYRINVVMIELPPLRDRLSDVPLLAEHFLQQFGDELGKELIGFTPEASAALRGYGYPGNVRELQNIVERAAVLSRDVTIGVDALPTHVVNADTAVRVGRVADDGPWEPMPLAAALRGPERRILLRALEANDWNRQSTADQLEINRTTLYKKMKQLGIEGEERRVG